MPARFKVGDLVFNRHHIGLPTALRVVHVQPRPGNDIWGKTVSRGFRYSCKYLTESRIVTYPEPMLAPYTGPSPTEMMQLKTKSDEDRVGPTLSQLTGSSFGEMRVSAAGKSSQFSVDEVFLTPSPYSQENPSVANRTNLGATVLEGEEDTTTQETNMKKEPVMQVVPNKLDPHAMSFASSQMINVVVDQNIPQPQEEEEKLTTNEANLFVMGAVKSFSVTKSFRTSVSDLIDASIHRKTQFSNQLLPALLTVELDTEVLEAARGQIVKLLYRKGRVPGPLYNSFVSGEVHFSAGQILAGNAVEVLTCPDRADTVIAKDKPDLESDSLVVDTMEDKDVVSEFEANDHHVPLKPIHGTVQPSSSFALTPSAAPPPSLSCSKAPPGKITKKPRTSKHIKKRKIPVNPFGLRFSDSNGNELKRHTPEFIKQMGESSRRKPGSEADYKREWSKFLAYVEDSEEGGVTAVEKLLSSELPESEVATFFSLFIADRVNLTKHDKDGVSGRVDTTTIDKIYYMVSKMMEQKTVYKASGNPAFDGVRGSLVTYKKKAKEVPGLGELANQSLPLSRAQLNFILHHDSLDFYTPRGLVSLFYFLFIVIFNPRVRTEVFNARRGDFKRITNPDGSTRYIQYIPGGHLKRDMGDRTGLAAARAMKRPVGVPCPSILKLDFPTVLDEFEKHLDMLDWPEEDRSSQKFFHHMKTAPAIGESFFTNANMGHDTFDGIVREVIKGSGIDVSGISLNNQCLRPTVFNLHTLLGFGASDMQDVAGHVSDKSNLAYRRANIERMAKLGGAVQTLATGVAVKYPDFDYVEMRIGPRRKIRKLLAEEDEAGKVTPFDILNIGEEIVEE